MDAGYASTNSNAGLVQIARLTKMNKSLKMAKEAEKSSLDKLMELMVTMRMDDEKRRQEERRERIEKEQKEKLEMLEREDRQKREQLEREERREEERERREDGLLTTLKEAQPAVPQKVNIHKLDLPRMKEGDDSVVFIDYLDSALKRSKVPENEWLDLAQTRIMLEVGQNLGDVFGNEDATF